MTADVLSATKGKQQPERLSRLQSELILLPATSGAVLQAPQSLTSEAGKRWDEIKDLSDVSLIEAFRAQYGKENPFYDRLASQRAGALKEKTPQWGVGTWGSFPWSSSSKPEPAKAAGQQTAVVAPKTPPASPPEPACDGLLVAVAVGKKPCIKPGSGESFKDCPDCPEMVVVPSGSFTMGSPGNEPGREKDEGPQHKVTIAEPFAVGRFAVTFAEWDACAGDGGCGRYKPGDNGWGRGNMPVINVSWDDAQSYVKWLSEKTGRHYRLLSEAEREYVTRAGKKSPFWWGASISPEQANYDGNYTYNGGAKGIDRDKTMPVKSFEPNPWGLYQVHGNVYDWVEDCYHEDYHNAPGDGPAWTTGECKTRGLRGGSWNDDPQYLRAAYRSSSGPVYRNYDVGFRVGLGWQDLNR